MNFFSCLPNVGWPGLACRNREPTLRMIEVALEPLWLYRLTPFLDGEGILHFHFNSYAEQSFHSVCVDEFGQ